MGTNISTQIINNTTSVINNVLSKSVYTVHNRNSTSIYNHQGIYVDLSYTNLKYCNIKIEQKSNLAANTMVDATSQIATEMSTDLQNQLAILVSNTVDQLNKGLNIPPQTNVNDFKATVNTIIKNNINNIVETTIHNILETKANTTQIITFIARNARIECAKGQGLNFTNESTISIIASNISDNLFETIIKNKAVNDVATEIENKVKQTNEGIDIFGGVIASICCLAIVAIIVMCFFGTTRELLKNKAVVAICIIFFLLLSSLCGYCIYKKVQTKKEIELNV